MMERIRTSNQSSAGRRGFAKDSERRNNGSSEELFFSESNMRALEKSWKQIEEGKVVTKTMEELEAMVNA